MKTKVSFLFIFAALSVAGFADDTETSVASTSWEQEIEAEVEAAEQAVEAAVEKVVNEVEVVAEHFHSN